MTSFGVDPAVEPDLFLAGQLDAGQFDVGQFDVGQFDVVLEAIGAGTAMVGDFAFGAGETVGVTETLGSAEAVQNLGGAPVDLVAFGSAPTSTSFGGAPAMSFGDAPDPASFGDAPVFATFDEAPGPDVSHDEVEHHGDGDQDQSAQFEYFAE